MKMSYLSWNRHMKNGFERFGQNIGKHSMLLFEIVFLTALLLRILLFMWIFNTDLSGFKGGDTENYVTAAVNLIKHGVLCDYSEEVVFPSVFRTPVYPAYLAVIFLLTGYSYPAAAAVQIVLASAACGLTYLIAARYTTRGAAFAAGMIMAFDFTSIINSNKLLTETLFTFFIIAFMFFFIRFLEHKRIFYLAAAGITAGFATLTRPLFFYCFAFMLIVLTFYFWKQSVKFISYLLLFTLTFFAITGPWIYRNSRLGYAGISAVQEFNLYSRKALWIEEKLKNDSRVVDMDYNKAWEKLRMALEAEGLEDNQQNRIKMYKKLAMETINRNPMLLFEYQMIQDLEVFTTVDLDKLAEETPRSSLPPEFDDIIRSMSTVYPILMIVTYLVFLVGIFTRKVWSPTKGLFFILMTFLYLSAISGEYGGGSRFRVPILPVMLCISSAGFDFIGKNIFAPWIRGKK